MEITFTCSCGKKYKVAAEHAGKKAKCSGCGETLTIPMAGAADVSVLPAQPVNVPAAPPTEPASTPSTATAAAPPSSPPPDGTAGKRRTSALAWGLLTLAIANLAVWFLMLTKVALNAPPLTWKGWILFITPLAHGTLLTVAGVMAWHRGRLGLGWLVSVLAGQAIELGWMIYLIAALVPLLAGRFLAVPAWLFYCLVLISAVPVVCGVAWYRRADRGNRSLGWPSVPAAMIGAVVAFLVISPLVLSGEMVRRANRERLANVRCKADLHSIGMALMSAQEQDYRLPSRLHNLVESGYLSPGALACPKTGRKYVYIISHLASALGIEDPHPPLYRAGRPLDVPLAWEDDACHLDEVNVVMHGGAVRSMPRDELDELLAETARNVADALEQ